MKIFCWSCETRKLLICALLLSLIVETVCKNGICTRSENEQRTRIIKRTHLESYLLPFYRCRPNRYYGETCIQQRTVSENHPETYNELKTVEFCCTGFAETVRGTCEPECNFPCVKSKCVAPERCECDPGYDKLLGVENICQPVCDEPCVNGFCSAPETCSCSDGYEPDPHQTYKCRPFCKVPCVNAQCTQPDTCSCNFGYLKMAGEEDSNKCQPYCSEPCHNGVCSEPEICSCFTGYKKDINNTCVAICHEECLNGLCTAPDFCTCFDGFQILENHYKCEPICNDCINSYCSAPNQCTCFPGYEMSIENETTCLPVCFPECVNAANCTAPNICECLSGFEKTDNPSVCKPFCSKGCSNGVCTDTEVCSCLWGYKNYDENRSDCSLESDKHECSFLSQVVDYNYNTTCFFLSGEFNLEEIIPYCKILQAMLNKKEKSKNDVPKVVLMCSAIDYFSVFDSSLDVEVVCDVDLEAHNSTSQIKDSNSYTQLRITNMSHSKDQVFFSKEAYTFESNEPSSVSAFFEETITPYENVFNEETDKKTEENELKVIFKNSMPDISQTRNLDIPLVLNITLRFLPLINKMQITETYFEQNGVYLDQKWCICNRNNKPWSLCAKQLTQMYFCPCKLEYLEAPGITKENSVAFSRIQKILVIISLVANLFLG